MVDAGDFRKGLTVEYEGMPFKVLEFQHSKQARQAAVIRTKMQNMLCRGRGRVAGIGPSLPQSRRVRL